MTNAANDEQDKQPMQADGRKDGAACGDAAGETGGHARESGGESGGGAYPNPHTRTEGEAAGFEGGQSGRDYHGPGVLGDKKADPDEPGQVAQGDMRT